MLDFLWVLVALTVASLACSRHGGGQAETRLTSTDPSAEEYPQQTLPRGRVVLQDASGAAHPVEVEIAASQNARTRGLMWRRHLAEGQGMLFVFPGEQVHAFWMKNTLIPLDMIFLDASATVIGVVAGAAPLTLSPRGPSRSSRYVLEVPAGWTAASGIRLGSSAGLQLPNPLSVDPEPGR